MVSAKIFSENSLQDVCPQDVCPLPLPKPKAQHQANLHHARSQQVSTHQAQARLYQISQHHFKPCSLMVVVKLLSKHGCQISVCYSYLNPSHSTKLRCTMPACTKIVLGVLSAQERRWTLVFQESRWTSLSQNHSTRPCCTRPACPRPPSTISSPADKWF